VNSERDSSRIVAKIDTWQLAFALMIKYTLGEFGCAVGRCYFMSASSDIVIRHKEAQQSLIYSNI
jgi:hypothetical protein